MIIIKRFLAKKFAKALKEIVQNAKPGEIKKVHNVYEDDANGVIVLIKDNKKLLEMHSKLDIPALECMRLGLDMKKNSSYVFRVYIFPFSSMIRLKGGYYTLKDLVDLVDSTEF